MELVLTLVGPDGAQTKAVGGRIAEALAGVGAGVKAPVMLGHGAADLPVIGIDLAQRKAQASISASSPSRTVANACWWLTWIPPSSMSNASTSWPTSPG
jgi:hypothetical protein